MWQEQKRIAEEQERKRKQEEEQILRNLSQTNPGHEFFYSLQ